MKLELDIWEWKLIERLANARNEIALSTGYNREPGNRNGLVEVSYLGVAGEIGFYKLIDRFPIISQDRSKASTPDLIIGERTIDIKSTRGITNDLMVSIEANKHYDVYVLMVIQQPFIYYIGYIDKNSLIVPEKIYRPLPKNGVKRSPFYRAP